MPPVPLPLADATTPIPVMTITNEDFIQLSVLTSDTKALASGNIEEVFYTPNLNDQEVTKRVGTDATHNEEEGTIPVFDEMLNMDVLYDGLSYPFDLVSAGGTKQETYTTEVAGKEAYDPSAKK